VARADRFLLAFVLVLAALAAIIIVRADMSGLEKVVIISIGTAFLIVRAGPRVSR
jgi:uncharacterized membrane protein